MKILALEFSSARRGVAVVDGDRVYLYGPDGVLCCVSTATGKEVWKVDTKAKYFFQQNFFGAGSVPVIDGDLLIVTVGGSEKGPRPIDLRDAKPNGTALVAAPSGTGNVSNNSMVPERRSSAHKRMPMAGTRKRYNHG